MEQRKGGNEGTTEITFDCDPLQRICLSKLLAGEGGSRKARLLDRTLAAASAISK